MLKPSILAIISLLFANSIVAQGYETCIEAQASPVSISSYPYSATVSIDPSWINDTDYNPVGLGDNVSVAYWAFTVSNANSFSFSFLSSGSNSIVSDVSIGLSGDCPVFNSQEIFFGSLAQEANTDCEPLDAQTYIIAFAVNQGNEGDITLTINESLISNDDCDISNPEILTVTMGSTFCADGEYIYCGMASNTDHQVWYQYTNLTGENVDLELTFSSTGTSASATDLSMVVFIDDCFGGIVFPGTSEAGYCNILGSPQTISCIENWETIKILVGSPEDDSVNGPEGEFNVSAIEISDGPLNDECTGAIDITPFDECEWMPVSVILNKACPEDFGAIGACNFDIDPTVWFQFTAPNVGNSLRLEFQNINDSGSYLTVFEADDACDAFSTTAINADCEMGAGPHGENYNDLIPGLTYLVAFGNPVPGNYSFELKINELVENDQCFTAETLIGNTPLDGTTYCATQEFGGEYNSVACTDNDETNTVFYTYEVPVTDKGFNIVINEIFTGNPLADINLVVFEDDPIGACNTGPGATSVDDVCTSSGFINEEFECVGAGNYIIRIATSLINSGGFEITIEPLPLEQPNDNCDNPDAFAFNSPPVDEWMQTVAVTFGACPEHMNLDPTNCGISLFSTVWYEINAPAEAEYLDLQINDGTYDAFIAVFENGPDCDNLSFVPGSSCYTGIFNDLEAIAELQIDIVSGATYLIAVGSDEITGGVMNFGIKWVTDNADCPDGSNIGDLCDDLDPCTINDMVNDDCICAGTFQDTDNDGTCDAEDVCEGPEPGTACNDQDACTINDIITDGCECIGIFQDTDNDGTCDVEDICENGPEPGTICDDGNICTIDDLINENCLCMGTFQDEDNDGTCDAEDICENGPEPGTSCDDGNICTVDDVITESCLCLGTFVDSDFDGVCDAEDVCNDGPEPGSACDDGDVCTVDDTINMNCNCAGVFQDMDNDGTCDADDQCSDGPEPGSACDDNDNTTFNDQITSDCVCVGTNDPLFCPGLNLNIGEDCDDGDECTVDDIVDPDCNCMGVFADSDEDGTCDANDICQDGPEPGTVCDDGDACTINDVLDSTCNCIGSFQDSDEDGTCDADDECPNSPEPGTLCDDNDETTVNDIITSGCICEGTSDTTYCQEIELYIGDFCDDLDPCTIGDVVNTDCNCVGTFQDSDNDGTCDAEDVCSEGPEPGTSCDDNDDDTFNDQITTDCECMGTIDPNFCPALNLNIGDECDDGDECTVDEIVDSNCECIGTYQDSDSDGICDADDNCPGFENNDQADNDLDNIGDVCDGDDDNDGIADEDDNCPFIANENQEDGDMDGIGDPCDILSNLKLEYNLNLYPNPTAGILFIDLLDEVDYKVLSVQGNILQVAKSINSIIDLTSLPNGLYIIELAINERPIGYKKIVKL